MSPVPKNYGPVPLTTTLTAAITATDTGTAPAKIFSTGITGTNAIDFAITSDGCSGKTLAPGASCQIVITFGPTAPGNRVATLGVVDSAPGSPHTDPLTGRGVELIVLPTVGGPSNVIDVIGLGWKPSAPVLVTWDPGLGSQTAVTDANGNFQVGMLLFRHDVVGPRKAKGNDGTTIIEQPFLAVPGSSGPPGWILRR